MFFIERKARLVMKELDGLLTGAVLVKLRADLGGCIDRTRGIADCDSNLLVRYILEARVARAAVHGDLVQRLHENIEFFARPGGHRGPRSLAIVGIIVVDNYDRCGALPGSFLGRSLLRRWGRR